MNTPLTSQDWMELSAYLDEQMAPAQRARLEQRLQAEPALRGELEEMRRLRLMLRSLKPCKVPHNFTLTHQMAMERRRNPLVPWLGWSSVLSSLLLVVSLFLRMNLSLGAQAPMVTKEMAAAADQAPTTEVMPMILNWAAPLGLGGGGGAPINGMGVPAAEGKGGGGGTPDYTANQKPFVGFPLPGTSVTTQDNSQLRVLETPTPQATQALAALATQAPAVQSAAPSAEVQGANSTATGSEPASILGLPSVQDQGTIRVLEKTMDTSPVAASQSSAVLLWVKEWWLSLLMVVLAVGSGTAALLLRRKHV